MKLFCDMKTDSEKAEFFRSGDAHETGIIARAIQDEIAGVYDARAAGRTIIESLGARVVKLKELNKSLVRDLDESQRRCDKYREVLEKIHGLGGTGINDSEIGYLIDEVLK